MKTWSEPKFEFIEIVESFRNFDSVVDSDYYVYSVLYDVCHNALNCNEFRLINELPQLG